MAVSSFISINYPIYPRPEYVNAVAMATATAENIPVPAGATHVLISGSGNFLVNFFGTASSPGDTTDGTASFYCATQKEYWFSLEPRTDGTPIANISVIPVTSATVTAAFYKKN
jgi:hypothetical protein